MTNRSAVVEFFLGIISGITILAIIILTLNTFFQGKEQPDSKFAVVDRYKQCDVVRYTDPSNRWNYFLDCPTGG